MFWRQEDVVAKMSTQFLGLMLMGVYFFFLCVSAGFWYYGKELENAGILNSNNNPILNQSLNLTELRGNFSSTVSGYQSGNAFNPALIFGDFGRGVTEFVKVVSGGYAMDMMQKLGFSQSFQTIMQVLVVGFGAAGALIYYISGRQ